MTDINDVASGLLDLILTCFALCSFQGTSCAVLGFGGFRRSRCPHRRDCHNITRHKTFVKGFFKVFWFIGINFDQSAPSTMLRMVPLPRAERSTSTNHTSLTLVFLGRFPIRPVAQSAASFRTCFLDRSAFTHWLH